jgi:hypothetical protein
VTPRLARTRDKPVPTTRHRLDKLGASGTLAQCFSQQRNVLSEVSFLNESVWPNSFHQIVFRDDLPTMLYERHKDVEHFRREWNELTFAQQDAFRRFQAETTEFIAVIVLLTH